MTFWCSAGVWNRQAYPINFSIWSKYNIRYGEESYRLGFEDGVQLATEREIRAKGSVLDVQDMAHLVSVHDAIND